MKKLMTILCAFAMVLSLAACGSNGTPDSENTVPTPGSSAAKTDKAAETETETARPETSGTLTSTETTEPEKSGAKSLVVYFSWSGNTENVAKSIQSQTGSDIFEIVPKTPYSTDYNTVVDDAKVEQQKSARPEIKDTIPNIADYDTVYVGFPNWWGDMPMILYTFFDTYDLSGKTVALFCTSGGSGLSNTVNEVKELEPNATVTKGLHIGSGASANPDSAVKSWLDEIGAAN